ncbi:MAG: hypothetical protein H0V73_06875 [Chloroflexi bacterium]|nr:hypothetical protein [Chloroflexota bacterium]
MKKLSRLPHDQAVPDSDTGVGPEHDGLPAADTDVEGHRVPPASFLPGMPGTGGDSLRRPVGGGEVGDDDVEGHAMGHTKGERLLPGMPGTGGDAIVARDEDVRPDTTGR